MAATFEVWLALFVMIAVPTEFTGAEKIINILNPTSKAYIKNVGSTQEGVLFQVTSPDTNMRPAITVNSELSNDDRVYYLQGFCFRNGIIDTYQHNPYDLCIEVIFSDYSERHNVKVRVPLYRQKEDDSEDGERPLIDSPIFKTKLNRNGKIRIQVDIAWMEDALTETLLDGVYESEFTDFSTHVYNGSPCDIKIQALNELAGLI